MSYVVSTDRAVAMRLAQVVGEAQLVASLDALIAMSHNTMDDLVVIGPDVDLAAASRFASAQRITRPELGVLLVRNQLDTETLTHALRAGFREVLDVDDAESLERASRESRELSAQVRERRATQGDSEQRDATVITVFSGKGGSGKTMVATNLAVALATRGRRTCLVDFDLAFGDVAVMLRLFPEHTIGDAVPMGTSIDAEGTKSLITKHSSGLDTLLAPVEPANAERIPASVTAALLDVLKKSYDVVVVDTPPAFTEHALHALDISDHIVLVTTLDMPSVKDLRLALRTLDMLGSPTEKRIPVINRSDSNVGVTVAETKKLLGVNAATEIPSSAVVPNSVNRGLPLVLEKPNHPVSKAIGRIADRVAETEVATQGQEVAARSPKVFWRKAEAR